MSCSYELLASIVHKFLGFWCFEYAPGTRLKEPRDVDESMTAFNFVVF